MKPKTSDNGAFRLVGIIGLVVGAVILALSLISYFLLNNIENRQAYGITVGSSVIGAESSYYYYLVGLSIALIAVSAILFVRNNLPKSRKIYLQVHRARTRRHSQSSRRRRISR